LFVGAKIMEKAITRVIIFYFYTIFIPRPSYSALCIEVIRSNPAQPGLLLAESLCLLCRQMKNEKRKMKNCGEALC